MRRFAHVIWFRADGYGVVNHERVAKPRATSCLIWWSAMTLVRRRTDKTYTTPASPRTLQHPCLQDPTRDSGSPGPRPAPSSPSTSSPQEYTILAWSDSLRAQSPCHSTHGCVGVPEKSKSLVIGGGATSSMCSCAISASSIWSNSSDGVILVHSFFYKCLKRWFSSPLF